MMRRLYGLQFVLASLTLVGCSPEQSSGSCSGNTSCDPGEVCLDGECERVCQSQTDCPEKLLCVEDICREPTAGALPSIESIAGNHPDDATRVEDGLVVQGRVLADASFELQRDSTAVPLSVESQSDSQARLVFPPDIRSGEYQLVATNQSGSDQAPVQLTLPDLTGTMLVDRINSNETTGQISLERLETPPQSWNNLEDIPQGFSDDRDNDALAALDCEEGQIPMMSGGEWRCADNGLSSLTAGTSCESIKQAHPDAANGVYWIDPDGRSPAGEPAFQVECNMTTGDGGWIVLTTQKSNNYWTLSRDSGNNLNKCDYDGLSTEEDGTYDHDRYSDDGCSYVVTPEYRSAGRPLTNAQVALIRGMMSEYHESSTLFAGECDSDDHDPGWESYATASGQGQFELLTTGVSGNEEWWTSTFQDTSDLPPKYLLPKSFRLEDERCTQGGGTIVGWTAEKILLR